MKVILVCFAVIGVALGGDVGCSGTVDSKGNPAIGCVQKGCCKWDNHVTDPELCDGENEVCCYSENTCEACEGTEDQNGNPAIGCVNNGCCKWNNHITNPLMCPEENTVCCYSENTCYDCTGDGWVDYRGYTISDQRTKDKLEQIADYFCTRLWVTSGDRDWGTGSLHDAGRAGDFWLDGFDANKDGQKIWDGLRASGLFSDEAWEVIWHGAYTCTGGIHFHVGRYAYDRETCFKMEGTTPNNVCDYRCHPL